MTKQRQPLAQQHGVANSPPGRAREKISKSRWRTIIVAFGLLAISCGYLLLTKRPLMVIEASVRTVEFKVVNEAEARIRFLTPAAIRLQPGASPTCAGGLFEPGAGARVTYSIVGDTLVIRTTAGKYFPDDRTAPTLELSESSSLAFGEGDGCGASSHQLVLPIWGEARIGAPPQPQTLATRTDRFGGMLLSGTVRVFGVTILNERIYEAGEVTLPSGAQISSVGSRDTKSAPWWGYAVYTGAPSPDGFAAALHVSASTQSNRLTIKRLGGGVNGESIEVGFLTRLTNDPAFMAIAGLAAAFLFICELLDRLSWLGLWRERDDP